MQSPSSSSPNATTATDIHVDSSVDAPNGTTAGDSINKNDNASNGEIKPDAQDATLEDSKERAKAVMAAAGVPVDSADQDGQQRPSSSGHAVNGTILTRKRSRSGSRIPASSHASDSAQDSQPSVQEYLLHKYIERDQLHAAAMNDQAQKTRDLFDQKHEELRYYQRLHEERRMNPIGAASRIYGQGYNGFGNGKTENKPGVMYPADKRPPGHRRTRELYVSRKHSSQQAEQLDELVPIRLDLELDKLKLRDTFTWNLHDRVVAPELFAETLVEDFKIPPELVPILIDQVNREIREQLQDYYPHVYIEEDSLDPHLPYSAYKNDEMRVLIKLNITIGPHTLVDQFEWEINNPLNSPEAFARQMAQEMSLSGEFVTAIAHSIREQCQMFTRSLYITGHPFDGRPIEDADVRDGFLASPLPSVFRPQQSAKEYAPYLYELTESELQREELSILREQRRQKRSVTRRGGPALPDLKDRARTVRTMLVSSVLPGAADSVETSRLYKLSRTSGRGRRATGRMDDDDDDDDDESDDSAPDSPAASQLLGGTSRQRAMRGAANAAQQALRGNIASMARSATPELASLHHHETRTSARRFGAADTPTRDESVQPAAQTTLVVKLKFNKEKFRRFLQNLGKRRITGESGPITHPVASALTGSQSQMSTPRQSNAALPSSNPTPSPAPTSRAKSEGSPIKHSTPRAVDGGEKKGFRYYPDGRADAEFPQPAESVGLFMRLIMP